MNARVVHLVFGLLVAMAAGGLGVAIAQGVALPLPVQAIPVLGAWSAVHFANAAFDRGDLRARAIRLGWPAWALSIAIVVQIAALATLPIWFSVFASVDTQTADVATTVILGCSTTLLVFIATGALVRVGQVAAETTGVVRTSVGSVGALLHAAGLLGLLTVAGFLLAAGPRHEFDFAFAVSGESPIEAHIQSIAAMAEAQGFLTALYVLLGFGAFGLLLQLAALIASFWLIPERVRKAQWALVDVVATGAMIFTLWTLPFVPEEDDEDVTLPAIALVIATVFITRALFRLVPLLFDRLEKSNFELQVAARMLRAKKSGFLTVIGLLSVLAVSFSSCTLSTTLSVMGGFRADLQQKILGNHAHVVVDREYGTFEEWQAALTTVRGVEEVSGATPYVSGEVMLTSAIEAPGGGELRGIDPSTIGQATDLERNMEEGSLDYLIHPELLVDLSLEQLREGLVSPDAAPTRDAPDAFDLAERPMRDDAESASGLVDEIDRILGSMETPDAGVLAPSNANAQAARTQRERELDEEIGALLGIDSSHVEIGSAGRDLIGELPPQEPAARPDVLPGLVLGRELARSMRLHVGDEVTVISPNGDLGPTGPLPRTRAFRVAGIFYTGMFEYDMQMAYTDLATAQSFLRAGEGISGIEIRVRDWTRADEISNQVRTALHRQDLRIRSWREVNRNLFGALELEKLAMFITLGIAILVASFCIFAALVLMVQEKGREVGILKAMGAEDNAIVRIFLYQGFFVGLFGAGTGLGLGYLVCFAAEHFKFIRMNPEVYYIDRLPVNVDPIEFVWVGIASVIVCVIATVYPAILGSRLKPVDALRQS